MVVAGTPVDGPRNRLDPACTVELHTSAIGPLARGPLSIFNEPGREDIRVPLPRARDDEGDDEDREELAAEEKKRAFPFNPFTSALESAREIERGRRIVSTLESSESLPRPGAQIDIFA